MKRKRKPSFFRKLVQAFGVTLILIGLYRSGICIGQLIQGSRTVGATLAFCLFQGVQCGFGLLMIFFNPHLLIQTDTYRLDRLNRKRRSRTFAEKIHAEDD